MNRSVYIGLIFLIVAACAGRPPGPDPTDVHIYRGPDQTLSGCRKGQYPCGQPTPFTSLAKKTLNPLGFAQRHYVNLLEHGDDALVVRLHLIRSAKWSIDFQTFIWGSDDVSDLFSENWCWLPGGGFAFGCWWIN